MIVLTRAQSLPPSLFTWKNSEFGFLRPSTSSRHANAVLFSNVTNIRGETMELDWKETQFSQTCRVCCIQIFSIFDKLHPVLPDFFIFSGSESSLPLSIGEWRNREGNLEVTSTKCDGSKGSKLEIVRGSREVYSNLFGSQEVSQRDLKMLKKYRVMKGPQLSCWSQYGTSYSESILRKNREQFSISNILKSLSLFCFVGKVGFE